MSVAVVSYTGYGNNPAWLRDIILSPSSEQLPLEPLLSHIGATANRIEQNGDFEALALFYCWIYGSDLLIVIYDYEENENEYFLS